MITWQLKLFEFENKYENRNLIIVSVENNFMIYIVQLSVIILIHNYTLIQ